MKQILLFSLLFFSATLNAQRYDYEGHRLCTPDFEFEEGSKEVLYGDNVTLRKQPNKDAAAIDTLDIGTEVKILKKMDETVVVNGLESHWYKVKCSKGTGYIAGGLIALDSKDYNGGKYLVITAKADDRYKVRVRYLKDGEYYGKERDLYTYTFYITTQGNKGVEGIESMLLINLFAEACGVDGGISYIFNDGEKLIDAIHCSSVSDGGVFWFHEELKFPEDLGWGTYIQYEREYGEPVDESMSWTRSIVHNIMLEWQDGALFPNVEEMEFDEE